MSTSGKVTICSASNPNEMTRPLSTYDNLNTNDTKPATTPATALAVAAADIAVMPNGATHNDNANHANQSKPNVGDSPFNGITFRFDEAKQPHYGGDATTITTNGYDNISDSEYEQHRNFTGMKMVRPANQVTTIAQNHLLDAMDVSAVVVAAAAAASLDKPSRGIMKPVHSEAKSQFLGLSASANGGRAGDAIDGAIDREPLIDEDEPLLSRSNGNGNRSVSMSAHRTQPYQIVANNSVCYGQNQIIDANEACACKTAPDNGIRAMHSDRYECDRCNESNNNNKRSGAASAADPATPTTSADADAANATITHVASSSYSMSESLSQVLHPFTFGPTDA